MSFAGDFALGKTFDVKFTTSVNGVPTALSSGTVAAYNGNSITESTTGITLTADFDSRTGLNNVRVVATGGNGYATATNYMLVLTAGTVGGYSVVGHVVGSFSIEARSALRPTTADRTLDVSTTGEAGVDWANVGSPTTTVGLSGTTISTSQAVASVSGAVGSVATGGITAASIAADAIGASELAADAATEIATAVWATAARTVTAATNITSTGAAVPITAGGLVSADVTAISTDTAAADNLEAAADGAGYNLGGGSIVAASVTGAVASVSGAVGSVTGNVGGNVVGSVASVTGAVGSVTGNVGGNVTGSVGSVAAGGITAASIATGAIDADALAADAVDEILDETIGDGTLTMRQALRVLIAGMAGKLSGAATTTVTIRNAADSADVIVATVDADGNRSAVTITP